MTHVTGDAKWDAKVARLVMTDPMLFHATLRRMKGLTHGEPFELDAVRLSACRSHALNRQYWGYVVRPLALTTRQSDGEIHRFLKAEFLPPEKIVLADADGTVKFERQLEASSRRLPKQVFEHFMEQGREFGMVKFGIDYSPAGLWEQFGIGDGG